MFKNFIRKRLVAMVATSLGAALVMIFQSKLGLDTAAAQDLSNKILEALLIYVGGQSATDAVAIYKGTKTE